MRYYDVKHLFESVLVEDINDVRNMFPSIDEDSFYRIIKSDPTYVEGRNSVGTYGKWLLNLFKKEVITIADLGRANELLAEFERKKSKIEKRDIGVYKSLEDLESVLSNTEEPGESDNQLRRRINRADVYEDAPIVYEDDDWVVYEPQTYEADCILADGAHWCTASRTNAGNMYRSYTSEGPLRIIVSKKDSHERYQYHVRRSEFKDKENNEVDREEMKDAMPGVAEFEPDMFDNHNSRYFWDSDECEIYFVEALDDIEVPLIRSYSDDFVYSCITNGYVDCYFEGEVTIDDIYNVFSPYDLMDYDTFHSLGYSDEEIERWTNMLNDKEDIKRQYKNISESYSINRKNNLNESPYRIELDDDQLNDPDEIDILRSVRNSVEREKSIPKDILRAIIETAASELKQAIGWAACVKISGIGDSVDVDFHNGSDYALVYNLRPWEKEGALGEANAEPQDEFALEDVAWVILKRRVQEEVDNWTKEDYLDELNTSDIFDSYIYNIKWELKKD